MQDIPPERTPQRLVDVLKRPGELWRLLLSYVNPNYARAREPIDDRESLAAFLDTRASFVAQTSLYGYLRTRAGMRYPELFDNDSFVASINIAKWHLWMACLSDLAVYAGGMILRRSGASRDEVARLMDEIVAGILDAQGVPPDGGDEFVAGAKEVRARVANCDWSAVTDDDAPFSESPAALVRWAPVIDELKKVDAPIVSNSVRFRWQEVRRHLRRALDASAILARQPSSAA